MRPDELRRCRDFQLSQWGSAVDEGNAGVAVGSDSGDGAGVYCMDRERVRAAEKGLVTDLEPNRGVG